MLSTAFQHLANGSVALSIQINNVAVRLKLLDCLFLWRKCKTRNKILNGSHPKILWLVNTFAVVTVKMSENLKKTCLGYILPQSHKNMHALTSTRIKMKPTYVIFKIMNYILPDIISMPIKHSKYFSWGIFMISQWVLVGLNFDNFSILLYYNLQNCIPIQTNLKAKVHWKNEQLRLMLFQTIFIYWTQNVFEEYW